LTENRVDIILEDLEEKTKKVIEGIYEPDELKVLLKQKDFWGRNAIWYMSENNVYRVLHTRIMDRIM
jgi:hypothetical protein